MTRLFTALSLPETIRSRLHNVRGGIPCAKWTAPENYHLTLRYIGEVDQNVAKDIDLALSEIRAPAFSIELSGVGYFGKGPKARILWVGVTPCDELNHLHAKVDAALVQMGVTTGQQRFSPHVTIARLKRPDSARLDDYVGAHAGFHSGPIPVDKFILYSSFLSQSGAIYTPEVTYSLFNA